MRVGRDGRPFQILKFRSMVDGADAMKQELLALNQAAPGLFKIANDPRVTDVGRWLRRAHLDELPQLWNVLRGEMSLVGPRPLVVEEDDQLHGGDRFRAHLTPALTLVPGRLEGPMTTSLSEMAKLDYLYISNWSLRDDINILLKRRSGSLSEEDTDDRNQCDPPPGTSARSAALVNSSVPLAYRPKLLTSSHDMVAQGSPAHVRPLVTGCAGFVGSHLAEALLDDGQSVIGVDCFNDNYARPQKLHNLRHLTDWNRFDFVPIDLARGDLDALVSECDVVYHLAAEPGVRPSWGRSLLTVPAQQRPCHAAPP